MEALASLPICSLGTLPNAMLADIAHHDALATGQSSEGMFFAARTFLQKVGITLGIMVFASLTNFGNSPGDDLGVRLSGPVGVVVRGWWRQRRWRAGCGRTAGRPSR